MMMSWQATVGATLSSTVTVAVQVPVLPAGSVAVKVTVTGVVPTSLQEKVVLSKESVIASPSGS